MTKGDPNRNIRIEGKRLERAQVSFSIQKRKIDTTYPCTRNSRYPVVKYVQISRPACSKVPSDWLHKQDVSWNSFGTTCIPKRTMHLPNLHVSDNAIRNLAEGPPMRAIILFICIPPLMQTKTWNEEQDASVDLNWQLGHVRLPIPIRGLWTLVGWH